MTNLAAIQALAAQQAAIAVDMNEATAGGGGRLIAAGQYFGRVCEYVDLGLQPQEYQGQAKDPAPDIRLGVALFWTNPETPDDPAPYVLRSSNMSISRNEKAGTFKAFAALNYKGDKNIKHFAQFLGQAFLFTVEVKKAKASGREYNVIVWDKTIAPIDPRTRQAYDLPQIDDDLYRAFLWDFPTKESWESLFIEGQNQEGKSKNFIQDTILAALNYQGSPLQLLLEGGSGLVAPQTAAVAPPTQAAPVAPPVAPVVAPTPAPEVAAAPAPLAPAVAPQATAPTVAPVAPALPVVPQTAPATPASSEAGTTASPSEAPAVVAPVVPNLPTIPGQPA